MKMRPYTIFILIMVLTSVIAVDVEEQKYIINFDSPIYVCPDDESLAFVNSSEVEVRWYNETNTYMTGTIEFLKQFELETMIEVIIDQNIDGDLIRRTSYEICDLCKELGDPDSRYRDYLEYFGIPEECPFEPGNYPIHDFVANAKNLPVGSDTASRYQITLNLFKCPVDECVITCITEKIFIACLKLDIVIEPV